MLKFHVFKRLAFRQTRLTQRYDRFWNNDGFQIGMNEAQIGMKQNPSDDCDDPEKVLNEAQNGASVIERILE
jgi:hypothetical protein